MNQSNKSSCLVNADQVRMGGRKIIGVFRSFNAKMRALTFGIIRTCFNSLHLCTNQSYNIMATVVLSDVACLANAAASLHRGSFGT